MTKPKTAPAGTTAKEKLNAVFKRVTRQKRAPKDEGMTDMNKAVKMKKDRSFRARMNRAMGREEEKIAREVIPIKNPAGFRRIKALLTMPIGGIPFLVTTKKVKLNKEDFTWRDKNFTIIPEDVAYVDGKMPVYIYDINKERPQKMAQSNDKASSAARNRIFKLNMLEQALAAVGKTASSPNWIVVLIAGLAVGYLLGVFTAPSHVVQAGITATTTTLP